MSHYKGEDETSENYEKVLKIKLALIKVFYGVEGKSREELLTLSELGRYYMKTE